MSSLPRGRRVLAAAAAALVLTAGLAGCGADPEDSADRASAISVLDDDRLGEILVDGRGEVLYVFEPDAAETVTCTFTCASNWPPLTAVDGGAPDAGEGVGVAMLGTLPDPAGGEVITYNGWPLYRYAADKSPGQALGQNTNLNGGMWYVMTPAGEPLVP